MKQAGKLTRPIWFGLFAAVIIAAAVCGFTVAKYQIFPYRLIQSLSTSSASGKPKPYEFNHELLQYAFKNRKIEFQIYPAVKNLDEITAYLDGMDFPAGDFFDAYNQLLLIGEERNRDIFKIDYQLDGRSFSTYAYRRDADAAKAADCAALVIPGSGNNQSTPIFLKDTENYHGDILNVFEPVCDSFVFVKPNEDFLAIHNGKRKLDYDFVLRYLLNKGGSYSANYLVGSLAFSKYLKENYPTVYVIGLSQGGAATLWNSLQSQPTAAVVASGFSVMSDRIDWAGFKQIIIPGLRSYYTNEKIHELIQDSKTSFLFTYGKKETGTYRIEAEEGFTCKFLGGLENVECKNQPGGHVFDHELIRDFINQRKN